MAIAQGDEQAGLCAIRDEFLAKAGQPVLALPAWIQGRDLAAVWQAVQSAYQARRGLRYPGVGLIYSPQSTYAIQTPGGDLIHVAPVYRTARLRHEALRKGLNDLVDCGDINQAWLVMWCDGHHFK